jgi:hypothetical protein
VNGYVSLYLAVERVPEDGGANVVMKPAGPNLMSSVREIFGMGRESRSAREAREAQLEAAVIDYFSGHGSSVRRQVNCGYAGVADVVTKDTIFELKDKLTRRTYQQALGQLLLYKNYLGPDFHTAIICNRSMLRKLPQLERLTGVNVIVWNPPYISNTDRTDQRS